MGNEDQPTKITTKTDQQSTTVEQIPKPPPEPETTTVETETTTVESKPAP